MASDEKSKTPFEDLDRDSSERETSLSPATDTSTEIGAPPQYEPPQTRAEGSSSAARATQILSPTPDKPIAIPAVDAANESPFLRAYAPILSKHKLPKDSFLTFLDQLNDAVETSPPMQVLDATGGILQSVPILFPVRWIGSAVSELANLGGHGISKGRSDSAIRRANKDIFGPRGLKVEIAKLDAVAHIAKIPILDSQGKVNRQAPLLQQLEKLSNTCTDRAQELDLQQQRIRLLEPWIAELEPEILPWTSKSRLTRFNAALKKNNQQDREQRGRRNADMQEEQTGFRKCLWLVIRKVESADGTT
ncbi:hypothetical protein N7510_000079 [Penicillium lagena]|uniref:uncharacterized protein n=1 Tax=Penicillium lagena TaxID=94218 RepID=UPI00253FDD72|nr:uncharacterized protein N7510_000079 [Penicillium lagena]KAJ5623770.1 hypothetical protein N7510_000079 [Penicillium lagena]